MNRLPYPWGREDQELIALYRELAGLKNAHPALRRGNICFERAGDGVVQFTRACLAETVRCRVDRADGSFSVEPV